MYDSAQMIEIIRSSSYSSYSVGRCNDNPQHRKCYRKRKEEEEPGRFAGQGMKPKLSKEVRILSSKHSQEQIPALRLTLTFKKS